MDIVIAVVLGILTSVTAYMGVYVTLHPPEELKAKNRWKIGFGSVAIITVIVIDIQAYIAHKSGVALEAAVSREGEKTRTEVRAENQRPIQVNIPPVSPSPRFPLSLDFRISIRKVLTIQNYGREVRDIDLRLTKYQLEADAFRHGQIVVSQYQQFGGASFLTIPVLQRNTTSKPLDLSAIKFLGFHDFPKEQTSDVTPFLDYYALRFTFRDPETGKRYAYYRVTSATIADPGLPDDPRWTGRSGPGNKAHIFMDDIPSVIEAHQRQLYQNSEESEYGPGSS